ncbi:MAG: OmpA family protein [Bacteroidota bacterium]|jgi:hypothetical protein
MRKSTLILTAFFLLLLVSSSCINQRTQPHSFVCPVVEQNCSPQVWSGIPYDTSAEAVSVQKKYFVFEPVKQLNTPNDEWCLSFITAKQAVLTFADENQQRAMLVRMLEDNRASLESGVGGPLDGSMGAFSFKKNNEVVFSAALAENLPASSELFSGKLKGNVLVDVISFGPEINGGAISWESHPALSADGNVLFFASDRWMDTKGVDLWFSIRLADGTWSEPVNCGDSINSRCDEITPFVSRDGKHLLFSSNGHETVGGYDIFQAEINNTFWTAVKQQDQKTLKNFNFFSNVRNLRPPLNTPFDEIFPSSPVDEDSLLYYSSNQFANEPAAIILRRGGFDIFVRRNVVKESKDYTAKKKIAEGDVPVGDEAKKQPVIDISPTYELEGTVYNDKTKQPIEGANVIVKEIPETNTYKDTKSDRFGHYSFKLDKGREYDILAEARNLFFSHFSLRIDALDTVKKVSQNIYISEELTLRINFPTDKWNTPYKYVLDSNGVETSFTWEKELDVLADNIKNSKELIDKIIFVGHTDDVGSDDYNMQLGQKRVEFIIAQLIKRGVSAQILEGKSAGESELIKQFTGEDIRMWRKRCRRVELRKVMKTG